MASFTGGCLCGRVRYTASAAPAFTGICHCRNCQRFTGSAFETVLGFPKEAVQIEGERKIYQDTSDAGRPLYRGFCPNCGSSLTSEVTVMPGVLMILAGTLDDPTVVQPTMGAVLQQRAALGGLGRRAETFYPHAGIGHRDNVAPGGFVQFALRVVPCRSCTNSGRREETRAAMRGGASADRSP